MKREKPLLTLPVFLGLSFGLLLFVGLILHQGMGTIASALGRAGAWGVFLSTLSHVTPLIADAASWRVLVDPRYRPTLATASRWRWFCESVNAFIPTGYLGGELVRIRLASRDGMPMATASASITVDALFGFLVQVAFTLIGVMALFYSGGPEQVHPIAIAVIPAVLSACLIGALPLLEKGGRLRRLVECTKDSAIRRGWTAVGLALESFNAEVSATFRDVARLATAAIYRVFGWALGILEVWIALWFLGHPVGFAEALMLESITQAARSIAFAVPSGLGVQEGALVFFGASVGITPDTALALSLLKRARELLLGVPGFLLWQLEEGLGLVKSG